MKKIWVHLAKNVRVLNQKIVKLIGWIRDPGSGFRIQGVNKAPEPDPGDKKALDPGFGSAALILARFPTYPYYFFLTLSSLCMAGRGLPMSG